jgi:hypothetical protein
MDAMPRPVEQAKCRLIAAVRQLRDHVRPVLIGLGKHVPHDTNVLARAPVCGCRPTSFRDRT